MNKILYITSEAYPLIKTGGLADVSGSLPRALQLLKQDVRLLLPYYPQVQQQAGKVKLIDEQEHYGHQVRVLETRLPGSRVTVWLVDCPAAFDRPGNPYVDTDGNPWSDNAFRFALFSQVAVQLALGKGHPAWQPDVVHCNDWQSALIPALLSQHEQRPGSVFTIHNLAYQGLFNYQAFIDLGLPDTLWGMNGLEFHKQLSFIKGGLIYADRINTVSPGYAIEIQQPEFGYGLDGLLKHRQDRVSGIINGIETKIWNPGTDPYLEHNYNYRTLAHKSQNKTSLQAELGLPVDADVPMLGMISRLVEQKGVDVILDSLSTLLQWPLQIVILGSGDKTYESQLTQWAEQHPDKLKVIIGYDEALSHRIEAAADIYLMPSKFEPCGLNQLYSLHYGTIPVVRNVGGLADTIVNATQETLADNTANGFYVKDNTPQALLETLEKALTIYHKKDESWHRLQHTAMQHDYSWKTSAEKYIQLYQQAMLDKSRGQSS
ncbi:MAG: glycogen synthase GlgA [Gammaproteobacteria bacterium]|nr:glycogen synthase GlgA [Gammaproteobacteria bacterium]